MKASDRSPPKAVRASAISKTPPAKASAQPDLRSTDGTLRPGKSGAEPVRHLKIGSVIVREYEGKIHEVMVAPGGFYWSGQTHSGLSPF